MSPGDGPRIHSCLVKKYLAYFRAWEFVKQLFRSPTFYHIAEVDEEWRSRDKLPKSSPLTQNRNSEVNTFQFGNPVEGQQSSELFLCT